MTPQEVRSGVVTAWLQPQFLDFDAGAGAGLPATPPPPAVPGPSPTPPLGDAIPQMVLADPLKHEDVVGCIEATASPSLALNEMASIALDDTDPPVGPPSPSFHGDADGAVALTVSLAAMDDRYRLPAPLRDGDSPATQWPTSAPVEPVVTVDVTRDTQEASGGAMVAPITPDVPDPLAIDVSLPEWLVDTEASCQSPDPFDDDPSRPSYPA